MLQTHYQLSVPLPNLVQFVRISLVLEEPKLDALLQIQPISTEQRATTTSQPAGNSRPNTALHMTGVCCKVLCWLTFIFLSSSTSRHFSAKLLSSRLSPSVSCCTGLFCSWCRTSYLPLFRFMRFAQLLNDLPASQILEVFHKDEKVCFPNGKDSFMPFFVFYSHTIRWKDFHSLKICTKQCIFFLWNYFGSKNIFIN